MYNQSPQDARLFARQLMVENQIRARGVCDERVLSAMRRIPREFFIPLEDRALAYEDRALPIGLGQTISQPFIVAYMTEQLEVRPAARVLEIGTGSGYQTAILTHLAAYVYTIERVAALQDRARTSLAKLKIENVSFRLADGSLGWPEQQPFDRIIVTAAAPKPPPTLTAQLVDGGLMIIPVGGADEQTILRVERFGTRLIETPMLACRFVRLIGQEGWSMEGGISPDPS